MTSIINIERFKDIRVSKIPEFDNLCNTLLADFQEQSPVTRRQAFAQSKRGGGVFVYETKNPKLPEARGLVLEIVPSPTGDFFACLFEPHPIFNTPGDTIKARVELIETIERLHHSTPGMLAISDPARGRRLHLYELGTMQLIDQVKISLRDHFRSLQSVH